MEKPSEKTPSKSLLQRLEAILAWHLGPYPGDKKGPANKEIVRAWGNPATSFEWFGIDEGQRNYIWSLIQDLMTDSRVPTHSRRFLEERLYQLLKDIAAKELGTERETILSRFLEDLYAQPASWRAIFFVQGLVMKDGKYGLGSLMFFKAEPRALLHEMPALESRPETERPAELAVAVPVTAANMTDAFYFARQLVEEALSILATYYQYWPRLAIREAYLSPEGSKQPTGMIITPEETIFEAQKDHPAVLDKDPDAARRLAEVFGCLLNGSGSTELGRRSLLGMKWLREARQHSDPTEKLIGLFTALEALLSDRRRNIGDLLAQRVNKVMDRMNENLPNLVQSMTKLWEKRCEAVHGARSRVSSEDIPLLDHVVTVTAWAAGEAIRTRGCKELRCFLEWLKLGSHRLEAAGI